MTYENEPGMSEQQAEMPAVPPTGDMSAAGETPPASEMPPAEHEGEAQRHASWMDQLQSMIEGVARQSQPALRELAAKAAELAAKAGDAAGPAAHRAAEVTGEVGQKVAVRGRELAAGFRRASDNGSGAGPAEGSVATIEPPEVTPGEGEPYSEPTSPDGGSQV